MAANKQYSRQELQEILDVALRKQAEQGDFGQAELLETARELGLSPEQVAAAEAEVSERRQLQALVESEKSMARRGLTNHLLSYVLVNAGLLVLNLLQGGPWWFQWPLLGWGIGVVAHVIGLARTSDAVWHARAARKRERERRLAERQKAKRRMEQRVVELLTPTEPSKRGQGEQALDQAVDQAVDRALGIAAQVIQKVSQSRDRQGKRDRDPPNRSGL